MFKISEYYRNNLSGNFEMKKTGRFYSLIVNGKVVREGYDLIFPYGENLFVLVSEGKYGVVQYDNHFNEICSLPCEYITLDEYWHNLLFSKENATVLYLSETGKWMNVTDAYWDGQYLYAEDENNCFIMDLCSGNVLWQGAKNRAEYVDHPCFQFCGKIGKNPMFYDVINDEYLIKTAGEYQRKTNLPSLDKPIIINGMNAVNICWENGKLGILDEQGKRILSPRWNEISIKLTLTCSGGDDPAEEVISVGHISAEDIIPFEEW